MPLVFRFEFDGFRYVSNDLDPARPRSHRVNDLAGVVEDNPVSGIDLRPGNDWELLNNDRAFDAVFALWTCWNNGTVQNAKP